MQKFSPEEAELIRWGFAVRERVRALLDVILPLPCFDYHLQMGSCDDFQCPSIDDKDPLCKTRRLLADQLASAIQLNVYDPLHPGYEKLPESVKNLIEEVDRLKNAEPPLPPYNQTEERGTD